MAGKRPNDGHRRRGARREETRNPFAAGARRAVRSADRPGRDRASLYNFARGQDMALIHQRRRAANRLGFAVHLSYLRFPGRAPRPDESPPTEMLAFISAKTGCNPRDFASYARRSETRWEHLGGLQNYLNARPFRREDTRASMCRAVFDGFVMPGSRRAKACPVMKKHPADRDNPIRSSASFR